MQVKVTCLRKDGKPYPRWQLGTLTAVTGELRIEEARDEHLNRFMRCARLLDHTREYPDVLPPLIDAAVLWIKGHTMSVTGFERIEQTDYAQTWLIEVIEVHF
jgi:hypothetical protein